MSADRIFAQLNSQNRALAALDKAARARVAPMVAVQFAQVRAYLNVVFANNPAASVDDVLARDDVRAVIDKAVSAAAGHVEFQIAVAASAAHQLGTSAARVQLENLGYVLSDDPEQSDSAYLNKVVERLTAATDQLRADIAAGVKESVDAVEDPVTYHDDPEHGVVNVPMAKAVLSGRAANQALDRALHNFGYRGELAVSAAAQRSYADAASAAYGLAEEEFDLQMGKMWVANYADGHVPCPVCAALSGQIVAWDDVFVVPAHLDHTAFGALDGPQAHPNCQCKLIPVPLEPDTVAEPDDPVDDEEPDDDTDELTEAATVAPEDAALPQYFTAQQVRDLPSKTFVQMMTGMLSKLISLIRRRRRG